MKENHLIEMNDLKKELEEASVAGQNSEALTLEYEEKMTLLKDELAELLKKKVLAQEEAEEEYNELTKQYQNLQKQMEMQKDNHEKALTELKNIHEKTLTELTNEMNSGNQNTEEINDKHQLEISVLNDEIESLTQQLKEQNANTQSLLNEKSEQLFMCVEEIDSWKQEYQYERNQMLLDIQNSGNNNNNNNTGQEEEKEDVVVSSDISRKEDVQKIEELEEEIAVLKKNIEMLTSNGGDQLGLLMEKINGHQDKINRLTSDLKSRDAMLKQSDLQISQYHQKLKKHEITEKKNLQEITRLKQKLNHLKNTTLKKDLVEDSEKDSEKDSVKDSEKDSEELKRLRQKIEEMEKMNEERMNSLMLTEVPSDEENGDNKNVVMMLRATLREVSNKLNKIKQDYSKVKEEHMITKKEIKSMSVEKKEYVTENESMQKKITTLTKQLEAQTRMRGGSKYYIVL